MANIAGQQPGQGSAFVPTAQAPVAPQFAALTEGQKALPDEITVERMSFTNDGVTYSANPRIQDVLTPGLLRRYRMDQMELFWRLIEGLFGDQEDAMAAIDSSWDVIAILNSRLEPHVERMMQATLGESSRSLS